MKKMMDFMEEANAVVPRIGGTEAVSHMGDEDAVFIDVRDQYMIAESGTIEGGHHVPRGLFEFVADEDSPMFNPLFDKSKTFYLICGAGGMAALAGKTMKDMGFENVVNIGGFSEWQEAGGPVRG
ncbi:MAG: rhodanese-like domain-containing protein [Alphaproteobacteria bacterium]|nr:rhodanese-like domain-containing protein [Alphaproteobacteria bacterium]